MPDDGPLTPRRVTSESYGHGRYASSRGRAWTVRIWRLYLFLDVGWIK